MKAAVFDEAHQPLTVENVEYAPLKRREVLVHTANAGLCYRAPRPQQSSSSRCCGQAVRRQSSA